MSSDVEKKEKKIGFRTDENMAQDIQEMFENNFYKYQSFKEMVFAMMDEFRTMLNGLTEVVEGLSERIESLEKGFEELKNR